ncbi:hypothetical protein GCM10010317_029210 [Streptomyces mirabilis]|nr:hypothetical protein GCM10010317_029210 [Streptomyces mirabilis]
MRALTDDAPPSARAAPTPTTPMPRTHASFPIPHRIPDRFRNRIRISIIRMTSLPSLGARTQLTLT